MYPSEIDTGMYPYEYYTYRANLGTGDEYDIATYLPGDDPDILRGLTNENADICYTSLDNIPGKVRRLATAVTEKYDNGYDKALALVDYLRYGKWKYSTDTPAPPKGKNFVEHFLFESDSGYCVHFSTAFVLMARSAGLPTRWVKGYNYGTKEGNNNYLICNNNAHTWGEVWFDDYGWVPFEPTPDNPYLHTVMRDGYRELIEPEGRWDRGAYGYDGTGQQIPQTNKHFKALPYLFLVVLLTIIYMAFKYIWYDINIDIAGQYSRFQSRLKLFGWQRNPWETPREHLQRMDLLPGQTVLADFIHQLESTIYGGKKSLDRVKLGSSYTILGLLRHRFISDKKNRRKGH